MKKEPEFNHIPEDYFDTFEDRVLERIRLEKRNRFRKTAAKILWPVAAALMIGTGLFLATPGNRGLHEPEFSSVENADWSLLLETSEFSEEDLTDLLSSETLDSLMSFGMGNDVYEDEEMMLQEELILEYDPAESPLNEYPPSEEITETINP